MIVSKQGLRVVEVTKADSKVPVLDNVLIEKDGTCVGSNGKSILMVSPVKPETEDSLNNVLQKTGRAKMVVSADTVKQLLKDLPADKQFGGLLEHCDIERQGQGCKVRLTDGKRRRSFQGKLYPRDYLPYRKIVEPALSSRDGQKVVLNLKRLLALLSSIEKICPDTTGESPVWVEFSDGQIILRGLNHINGQRCIGIMSTYKGIEGRWLEPDDWEKSYLQGDASIPLTKHKKKGIVKGKRKFKIRRSNGKG